MKKKRDGSRYRKFRFDAGSLALNYVATVRHRGSTPRDLLFSPEALINWFDLAGFPVAVLSVSFEDYHEALLLREAIYKIFRSCIENKPPKQVDVDCINSHASHSQSSPRIDISTFAVQWVCTHPVRACLCDIARDAIMILAGSDRDRLKMCDNRTCRMLFLDNSPAGRRRWCSMTICGNRDKVRAHRRRKREMEEGMSSRDTKQLSRSRS